MPDSMKLGFILNLDDVPAALEVLAFAKKKILPGGRTVVFMMGGKGMPLADVPELLPAMRDFVVSGGRVLDCHPCLALSSKKGSGACKVVSIGELPEAVCDCANERIFSGPGAGHA